jgi:hypothetical protein
VKRAVPQRTVVTDGFPPEKGSTGEGVLLRHCSRVEDLLERFDIVVRGSA